MNGRYEPSRPDGRTDTTVIYELVSGAEPGVIFTHAELEAALADGVAEPITSSRRGAAARRANARLLHRDRRALQAVRGLGYRVLAAAEHLPSARERQARASMQMARGIELLRKVRWDELTPDQRRAHEAQLNIAGALHQSMLASEQRHASQETAIDEIRRRLARLERDRDAGDAEAS